MTLPKLDSGRTLKRIPGIHQGISKIYDNTNVASELATRQGVETTNPSVTYDTSNLWNDPAYWMLLSSADATFDANMQSHENDFDTNVQQHQSDFDSNMAGHAASYDSAIAAANTVWDTAVYGVGGAQETYSNATTAAENAYSTAVYDAGGIQDVYDNAISNSQNQLSSDIAAAELTFQATLAPAVTAYENTVAQAQQDYEDWLNGTSPGTSFQKDIRILSVDFHDPTLLDTLEITTTITSLPSGATVTTVSYLWWKGLLNTADPLQRSNVENTIDGTHQSTDPTNFGTLYDGHAADTSRSHFIHYYTVAPSPSVRMNVYELAIYERTESFYDEMQTLADDYAADVQLLQQTHDSAVQAAVQIYDTAVYGSGGFAEVYNNAVASASPGWDSNVQNAQSTFSTAEMNFWMTWNMIDPMTPLQQAVKDYDMAVHDANLTYINAIGDTVRSRGLRS